MKAVLTHKFESIYDDLPEERYHLPRTYLRQAEQVVGNFVVCYEPGRTGLDERARIGRRAQVATAGVSVRDAAFAAALGKAYQETCAGTALEILNGGGRAEVQAAHVRPVAEHGPDAVRNGLALSGTVHWLFDRGLVPVGRRRAARSSSRAGDCPSGWSSSSTPTDG